MVSNSRSGPNLHRAFIHTRTKSGSWGFIIRACDSDVVMTGRGKVEHLISAFHVELIACLQGIQSVISLGIGHLVMETDAQEVVIAIKTDNYLDAAAGHIVEEVKSLVDLNFISFECVFKGRESNQAAHELAVLECLCAEGEEQILSSALIA